LLHHRPNASAWQLLWTPPGEIGKLRRVDSTSRDVWFPLSRLPLSFLLAVRKFAYKSQLCLVLALLTCIATAGCALWHPPRLDLNKYRDPRAVDIDDRLGGTPSTTERAE
jgi:hypothetical protein